MAETPVVEIRGGSGESVATPAPATPTPSAAATSSAPGRYGPLTRRDTLWSIAEKVRPSERATIYQTIIAIYDNNPGAFEGGNINTLKPGAYIDLPTEADVRAVDRRTAVARFTQLSTGKPARQAAKPAAPAATPAPAKAEPATTATTPASKTATTVTTTAATTKVAEPAPAQPSEPVKPATGLKGQAEQQQISELQAALATEREQLARLRSEVDAKQNEITLLREQIGRDEALQQQVADLMRANRELEALRELHQRGLSDRPWYQPLGESTTLLSLFLGIPTLLLIALLWALFLRKPQVVAAPAAATGDAHIADLAKEEANLEGGSSQSVSLPSAAVDLTSEVEAALALDDLDDLLLPDNGKKQAAASGNLLARDDSLDLGDIGTTIDLSGGDDSLPDLDDLLGQSKPAAAKPAAPAAAVSADDELNLDDLDSLLASFDAEKKPGKAEPEPAAPVQEPTRPSDAILSDDDLLAALGEADDAAVVDEDAQKATAASLLAPEQPESSLEELLDLESGATASQAEAEELDLEQLIEIGEGQPVLATSETAAESEVDLEALGAETEVATELDLTEVGPETQFDLEEPGTEAASVSLAPEQPEPSLEELLDLESGATASQAEAEELDLEQLIEIGEGQPVLAASETAAEAEFDLEALSAEPEVATELDLSESAAASEFDLDALSTEPEAAAELELSEVAAEAEFDLEALSTEPEAAAELELSEVAAESEFDLETLSTEPEAAAELDLSESAAEAEFDLEALSTEPEAAAELDLSESAAESEFDLETLSAEPEAAAELDLSESAAEAELDLEALGAEPAAATELDLSESAAESEFDLETLSAEPEAAAELDLSESASASEFDLEALNAETATTAAPEVAEQEAEEALDVDALAVAVASESLPDLVAQPEDEQLETTLASGTRVVDDDLDLDLTQFEGVTADELLRQIEQADEGNAEVELLSLEPETEGETLPSVAEAGAEEEVELAAFDEFGSFTEEDAEKFNEERHELQFDGVADFTEESLQAAARKAAASEQAAVAEERSLEDALAALGEEEADDSFALELDDDEIAANLAALGLEETGAQPATSSAPPAQEPELDAADTANRNQQLLAELEALGSVDEALTDNLALTAADEMAVDEEDGSALEVAADLEQEDTAAELPSATALSSPAAPAWDLSPVEGDEALATEVASAAADEEEQAESPAIVVGGAALADDELSVSALATPAIADFDVQTEQALASLDQPVARRTPLFAADHSDSDRLGEALPPGFHGQSKVQSAFRGFEELLPEVNHIDVDADNGCNAKLDLARAYIEIDDPEGARDILDDVLAEGSVDQRLEAQRLLLLLQRSL